MHIRIAINDIEAFFTCFLFQDLTFKDSNILAKHRAAFKLAYSRIEDNINSSNYLQIRKEATKNIFKEELSWGRDKQIEFIYNTLMQIKDFIFNNKENYTFEKLYGIPDVTEECI